MMPLLLLSCSPVFSALNRAVTISLLVRQELERTDQVVTQAQRCFVRFDF